MTATNHALTGALIAATIQDPIAAIPLAFLAHFAMDAIPHFGLGHKDAFERNSDKRFINVLIADAAISLCLLVSVPLLLSRTAPYWVTLLTMVACMSPDLVWGWHFYNEVRKKVLLHKTWFSKFHKKIQWSETPHGAIVESIWFIIIGSIILLIR